MMMGEFEYLLISVTARLGEDAYGAAIRQEIERATGRRCSVGALYTTLDRLERKGLIETWMGEATPQRGGRSKRMVRVTAQGSREAAAFYRAVSRAESRRVLADESSDGSAVTALSRWLVDRLSLLLDSDQRNAVQGDFTELGLTNGETLRELLGLVVRRQAALCRPEA